MQNLYLGVFLNLCRDITAKHTNIIISIINIIIMG